MLFPTGYNSSLGNRMGELANHHPPPRTRTSWQRPHLARCCPGWGWPLPVALKPQPGHSRLQRNVSGSLWTIRCGPPPFFRGGFAGGVGGTVIFSRAAISSLVSLSLGLDRPSREVLLDLSLLVSVSQVGFG